jgi:hypothetical protein
MEQGLSRGRRRRTRFPVIVSMYRKCPEDARTGDERKGRIRTAVRPFSEGTQGAYLNLMEAITLSYASMYWAVWGLYQFIVMRMTLSFRTMK